MTDTALLILQHAYRDQVRMKADNEHAIKSARTELAELEADLAKNEKAIEDITYAIRIIGGPGADCFPPKSTPNG